MPMQLVKIRVVKPHPSRKLYPTASPLAKEVSRSLLRDTCMNATIFLHLPRLLTILTPPQDIVPRTMDVLESLHNTTPMTQAAMAQGTITTPSIIQGIMEGIDFGF